MRNFLINNASDTAEIDIFGTIGEDWFDEGYTMEKCREDLSAISGKPLTLNVASLGGDVNHALVIHDLIKSHNAPVTARIMGATASAGTIVALAANQVQMSENSLFLVHNAWTFALGNAEELRKTAGDLDQFDNRLVNIYTSKTGKQDTEVRDLMAEERWIDASEAMDFGFIDAIYKPAKAAASALKEQFKQIKADGRLPELPRNINTNELTMNDEIKGWFEAKFAEVKALFQPKDEEPVMVTEEDVNARIDEIQAKVNEIEVTAAEELAEKGTALETLTAKNTELTEKLAAAEASFSEIQEKYNTLTAKPAGVEADADPDPAAENHLEDKYAKEVAAVKDYIKTFKPKNS